MDSTFYFFFGLLEQGLISKGAKRKGVEEIETTTFDKLPAGYW